MKLYEINEFNKKPFFRKMKVESGFMYNFWNEKECEYNKDWIFVPEPIDSIKKLQHHRDTTIGLWATDRPDLMDDPDNLLFEITD